ncbi:MAG: PEP/pyruvate-binding domain-containing protein, partial [SAR324 cluster bacterium]|nr:PEP/pyruvate-binding domain-containing protein [SAR324 cluster bacterium]
MNNTRVYPFAVQDNALAADLDTVGGKGLSLARMTATGFPVPAGFTVTTAAYRQFVSDNDLQQAIIDGAKPELVGTAVSFDSASQQIQALFAKSELSDTLKAQIAEAYAAFGGGEPPVAVRSSANAEDLPDLSFAG